MERLGHGTGDEAGRFREKDKVESRKKRDKNELYKRLGTVLKQGSLVCGRDVEGIRCGLA